MQIPTFGLHTLQACAIEEGFNVEIFYANLFFESLIGKELNSRLIKDEDFLSARLFSHTAFDKERLSNTKEFASFFNLKLKKITRSMLLQIEECIEMWLTEIINLIKIKQVKIVGITSSHFQTPAGLSILKRLKEKLPHITTIIGGPNCLEEMAAGMNSISNDIDYIFSGESEKTFVQFLSSHKSRKLPQSKILEGDPEKDLNTLPPPIYDNYYEQLELFLPSIFKSQDYYISYETSRGCWWGAKKHCTFCGLSDTFLGHREKSTEKIIKDLSSLQAKTKTEKLFMTDNIMPFKYYNSLLPKLGEENSKFATFYELKANIDYKKAKLLSDAGIGSVQPGIEALSSSLLDRMNKGIMAFQNINALKYFRTVDISLSWNLIYGFPGDTFSDYEELNDIIPLLEHFHAPENFGPLGINRFSPFFNTPEKFGIKSVEPIETMNLIYPTNADIEKLSYDFKSDFDSFSRENPPLIKDAGKLIRDWQLAWKNPKHAPELIISSKNNQGEYTLKDTRSLNHGPKEILITKEKIISLVETTVSKDLLPGQIWAIENNYALVIDERYIPLVCFSNSTIHEFTETF
jgi:ribosomal peptide maturation radical SAM protein 1